MDRKTGTIKMQKILVFVSISLFIIKMAAWYLTKSVAILTDALESTVNVVAGLIGLYSIILSSKPKDKEHPYGHGKVEFISSAIEGILIILAGFIIIYEAILHLYHPQDLKKLDVGFLLIAFTAIINYVVGHACVKKGRKENSPILIGSGAHLKSDTYSTLGLLLGLLLIKLTGLKWIDSLSALLFSIIIIYNGYKIIRKSIAGMMDENDNEIISQIVKLLNEHRQISWVDIHNMRVIDYAGFYHIDCHLTVPYYLNIHQGHQILDSLTDLFKAHFNDNVEFFIHIDGCLEFQCKLCELGNCSERKHPFIKHVQWSNDNIQSNEKHRLE